jgi:hypothetical protein
MQPVEVEKFAKPVTRPSRFRLIPFRDIAVTTERTYAIKGLIPRTGLVLVWGPPKCGKSFWAMDAALHIALGWEYRGRKVQAGPVVYLAAEGAHGFTARIEAYRQRFNVTDAPFYLEPVRPDLVADHAELIAVIRDTLGDTVPAVVVVDTLNRTFTGSESSDEDMTAYVQAADAIVTAFGCAVVVVHHCGIEGSRPRGHTSLTGAVDAQIAIARGMAGNATATVEHMKDGAEGDVLAFRLETVEVGTDDDGDPITSCVVEPADAVPVSAADPLTANQKTMFGILHDAGAAGLLLDEWNGRTKDAGIGKTRHATLYDIRKALEDKGLVREAGAGRWVADR